MTSISSSAAPAEVRAAPKAKARNAALDRARTFITMLVLIHHSVIRLHLFRPHRPPVVPRLRRRGDCSTTASSWRRCSSSVGAVRLAKPAAQGHRLVPARPLLAARPALHRLRGDPDAGRLLRDRSAAISPKSASRISGGRRSRSGPGRADRPGSSGCCWRSMCSQRSLYLAAPGLRRSHRPAVARKLCAARTVLLGAADRIDRRLCAGGALFRRVALVHVRPAGDSGQPHSALSAVFLRRRRHRRGRLRRGLAGRRTADWRGAGRYGSPPLSPPMAALSG